MKNKMLLIALTSVCLVGCDVDCDIEVKNENGPRYKVTVDENGESKTYYTAYEPRIRRNGSTTFYIRSSDYDQNNKKYVTMKPTSWVEYNEK